MGFFGDFSQLLSFALPGSALNVGRHDKTRADAARKVWAGKLMVVALKEAEH
jgi:hypothetical protein